MVVEAAPARIRGFEEGGGAEMGSDAPVNAIRGIQRFLPLGLGEG